MLTEGENRKLTFFVSDVHLGLKNGDKKALERRFLDFLDSLPSNTETLYLLGDIFDFWYEYKYVIPRGFTRVLGSLARIVDRGVKVYFIRGNHDIWTYSYLQEELGIEVLNQPLDVEISGKKFHLGHGHGLGYSPFMFRFMSAGFNNRFIQMIFSAIHPRWALAAGYSWSGHSRASKSASDAERYRFKGKDEPIYKYSLVQDTRELDASGRAYDYFIYGHFHQMVLEYLPSGAQMYIMGHWCDKCDFLVFDGEELRRMYLKYE